MHQPSVAIPWAGSISILFLGQDRAKNRRSGIRPLISMILAILAPLICGRPKSDLSSHHRHGPATRMMNGTGSQGHAGGDPHDRRFGVTARPLLATGRLAFRPWSIWFNQVLLGWVIPCHNSASRFRGAQIDGFMRNAGRHKEKVTRLTNDLVLKLGAPAR